MKKGYGITEGRTEGRTEPRTDVNQYTPHFFQSGGIKSLTAHDICQHK